MKKSILALVVLTFAHAVFAADTDLCRSAALGAAEDEYGNYPNRTYVKTVELEKEYRVAVGIGNPEDGEHDYYVVFPNGCTSKPTVTEINSN